MVIAIKKIIAYATSPMGVLIYGALIALLLAKLRRERLARAAKWIAALAAAQFLFFSTPLATRLIGAPLEREFGCAGSLEGVEKVDMVCVLGGGVGRHEKCGKAELHQGADRIIDGALAFLALAGRCDKICVSGAFAREASMPIMMKLGVPESAFVTLNEAKTTAHEAQLVAEMLPKGATILLVTSAWHLRRARLLFEQAGLKVIPYATDSEMSCVAESEWGIKDFTPSADALYTNTFAVKEWIGNLAYRILSIF